MRTSHRVPSARSVAMRLNRSPPMVADVVCPRRRHDLFLWSGSRMVLSIANQYEISHLALEIQSILDDAITYRSDRSEGIERRPNTRSSGLPSAQVQTCHSAGACRYAVYRQGSW